MSSFASTIRSGQGTLLLFLGLTSALWAQGPPPTPIRYTAARQHDLRQTLTLPGSIEAQTASIIASSVEGLVEEFPAKEGMRVSKGQVLAQLRTGPRELQLAARRASLQEAEARLKLAESNLARSRELFAAGHRMDSSSPVTSTRNGPPSPCATGARQASPARSIYALRPPSRPCNNSSLGVPRAASIMPSSTRIKDPISIITSFALGSCGPAGSSSWTTSSGAAGWRTRVRGTRRPRRSAVSTSISRRMRASI